MCATPCPVRSASLPDGAETPSVVKADANAQAIMRLSITSDSLGIGQLTDLVNQIVIDRLSAVPGVADVQLYGDQSQIFTVDVNQGKLAARGLTLSDLNSVFTTISIDSPGRHAERRQPEHHRKGHRERNNAGRVRGHRDQGQCPHR